MRVITGDETGLLKSTGLEAQRIVVAGTQSRARAIRALCWAQDHTVYAAARQDGVVTLWEDADKMPRLRLELKGAVGADVVGMAACGTGAEERILAAHEGGQIRVLSPFAEPSEKEGGEAASKDWEVSGPLSCMALAGTTLAAGGKERELGLWDAATGQAVWEARNVPHDKLDLRQPVWVTAASFLDPEGAQRTVAVGTAHKQIRIYDARAQRRPVRQADFAGQDGHYRITALCAGLEVGSHLVSGDAGGTVLHLDAGSSSLRVLGRMEGPAGSIRALARHPDTGGYPFVAVAGLDRMARVYDLRRPRKAAYQYYLKQRLTALLLAAEGRRGRQGRAETDAARRARLAAEGGVDEGELEGMEDDVASFDGEEGSSDEEEEEEAVAAATDEGMEEGQGRGRGQRKAAGGVSCQRIHHGSSEGDEEAGGEGSEDDSDEEEEEDDEPVAPFGRRGDAAAVNIELNIEGVEEEEEDSEDEESEGEEDVNEEDEGSESSDEEEEAEEEPPAAAVSKRLRRR